MPPHDRQLNTSTLKWELAGYQANDSCMSRAYMILTRLHLSDVNEPFEELHNTKLFNVVRNRVANFIIFRKILVDLIIWGLPALTWFRDEG